MLLLAAGDGPPQLRQMPWISLPALTAPGPSGERPEHMTDCMAAPRAASKRRLHRALDAFT
eukprot:3029402-Heterocapsa_arctica.AAC.1